MIHDSQFTYFLVPVPANYRKENAKIHFKVWVIMVKLLHIWHQASLWSLSCKSFSTSDCDYIGVFSIKVCQFINGELFITLRKTNYWSSITNVVLRCRWLATFQSVCMTDVHPLVFLSFPMITLNFSTQNCLPHDLDPYPLCGSWTYLCLDSPLCVFQLQYLCLMKL